MEPFSTLDQISVPGALGRDCSGRVGSRCSWRGLEESGSRPESQALAFLWSTRHSGGLLYTHMGPISTLDQISAPDALEWGCCGRAGSRTSRRGLRVCWEQA
jgi:hypothetical protein